LILCCAPAAEKEAPAPRPIEMKDILGWKSIRSPQLSHDGQWLAYQLAPNEGDAELVLRSTKTDKETRYPIGQLPSFRFTPGAPPPSLPQGLAFSDDSKWLAFTVFPTQKETKALRKQRRPAQNKVMLVNVASGEKREQEKVRRFAFSGENAGWLALHKYAASEGAPSGPPAPSTAAASSSSSPPSRDRPSGSDLILMELATGAQLNIGNVSEFAFDKKGRWLAWTIDAADKSGNGVALRNMSTGVVAPLDSDKAVYKRLNWTEKSEAFAVLKGAEDKKYENELYTLVAFKNLSAAQPAKVLFEPASDASFPKEMTISPNRSPQWTEDLGGVLFGIHELKKKDEKKQEEAKPGEKPGEKKDDAPAADTARDSGRDDEDKPDVVVWHWQDKRLQAQQQVEENSDKNFSYLCIYRVDEKKFMRLADETLRRVTATPENRYAVGIDNREYELMGSLDGRRYEDLYAVDLKTGERKLAVRKARWYFGASPQNNRFLYYDDGNYFVYDMAAGQPRNITQKVPASFINTEDDHNVVKPPVRPVGWVKGGGSVLLYDNWDVWHVPVDGAQAVNLTVNGKREGIRYRLRFRLDPEEKGIDLAQPLYFQALAERSKKGGIARIDNGKPDPKMLLWDDAAFNALMKSKKADVLLYSRETFEKYPDLYVAGPLLQEGRKLTDAAAQQKNFLWSKGSRLIDYVSAKGDKLQAALYLPASYEPGKSYPTVVYIYEKLTANFNHYYVPTASSFNKSVYTSSGYAVLMPDIVYKVNDPGMSAVWCVVPAVKAAIATGIVDKDRVAIHGHSWGGYQTAFLVTQTDIFRAAIAGAPLTNMISMYSSVYWNTGSANQPIFESSQGRFTGPPSAIPDAYVRNSPVYFAKSIKTPLVILHNDKDGAVDWNQGVTYYNEIRRLQKPVVMLQYKGENHGLQKPANQRDYAVRMREFFDHHLMGKPAPKWWAEGINHLKIEDELKERAPLINPPPDSEAAKKASRGGPLGEQSGIR
jgi:dipeptidyl aminopeptidase/acylaminoacyl peptidase